MTKVEEKMVNVLTDTLSYCYCDNCKYSDYEKYGDRYCDDCHRKYSNWALSPETAEEIVKKVISIFREKDLVNKFKLAQTNNINAILYDELRKIIEKCRMN